MRRIDLKSLALDAIVDCECEAEHSDLTHRPGGCPVPSVGKFDVAGLQTQRLCAPCYAAAKKFAGSTGGTVRAKTLGKVKDAAPAKFDVGDRVKIVGSNIGIGTIQRVSVSSAENHYNILFRDDYVTHIAESKIEKAASAKDVATTEPGMLGVNPEKARALAKTLERQGFQYRFPLEPPKPEMVRHGFVKYGLGEGEGREREWKILNERKNGYHNVTALDTKAKDGDYGANPLGNGKFKMVPSGDIVDYEERRRRLAKDVRAKDQVPQDCFDAQILGV